MTPQEHVTAAVTAALPIGTGALTFLHILPELLGCILSLCGIVLYVITIVYKVMDRKAQRKRRRSDVEDTTDVGAP
jgi:hypothetical protein